MWCDVARAMAALLGNVFITASESFKILKRSDQHVIRNNLGRGVSTHSPHSEVLEYWCRRRFGCGPMKDGLSGPGLPLMNCMVSE